MLDDDPDRILRARAPAKKIPVELVDRPVLDQLSEQRLDRVLGVAIPEDDRIALDLSRLHQRQRLEELFERSVAPQEGEERGGELDEHVLADEEVGEDELPVEVDIRLLLARQADVQPDRDPAPFAAAAVGGFHDPGPAARDDVESFQREVPRRLAREPVGGIARTEPGRAEDRYGGLDVPECETRLDELAGDLGHALGFAFWETATTEILQHAGKFLDSRIGHARQYRRRPRKTEVSAGNRGDAPDLQELVDEEERADQEMHEILQERRPILFENGMADRLKGPSERECRQPKPPAGGTRSDVEECECDEQPGGQREIQRRVVEHHGCDGDLGDAHWSDADLREHGEGAENDQRDAEKMTDEIAPGAVVGAVVGEQCVDSFQRNLPCDRARLYFPRRADSE